MTLLRRSWAGALEDALLRWARATKRVSHDMWEVISEQREH